MKLLFFPSPYPDELLFSVVSRYDFRSANSNSKFTNLDIFGTTKVCTNIDFSSNLSVLHGKLNENSLLTAEYLATNSTMFPLFVPFMPKEQSDRILALMQGPVRDGSSMFKLPMRTGRGSNAGGISSYFQRHRYPYKRYLRYCPQCIIADVNLFGESYWHRSHQIYGIDVCHRHVEWLIETNISANQTIINNSYFIPDDLKLSKGRNACNNQVLSSIAKSAYWLLNHNKTNLHVQLVRLLYQNHLQTIGYDNSCGGIEYKRLNNDIVKYFNEKNINTGPIKKTKYDKNIWLENVLVGKFNAHPIDHLYFIDFLGLSVEELFQQTEHFFNSLEPIARDIPCLKCVI